MKTELNNHLKYKLNYKAYYTDWSSISNKPRLVISSFEYKENQINIYDFNKEGKEETTQLKQHSIINELYPPTKVMFQPELFNKQDENEWIASSTDCIKLYKLSKEVQNNNLNNKIVESYQLINPRGEQKAPLTSFDWSQANTNLIISSSIDTTCTIWDLNLNKIKTQLIAHDREVLDVQFASSTSADVFGSVGADGSVRLFDLRSLDQSTIIYETCNSLKNIGPSLLRLKFNYLDPNYLAIIAMDTHDINILDIRKPFSKLARLYGHTLPPTTIDWHPKFRNILASSGEGSPVYFYDLGKAVTPIEDKNSIFSKVGDQMEAQFITHPNCQVDISEEVQLIKFCNRFNYLSIISKNSLNILEI